MRLVTANPEMCGAFVAIRESSMRDVDEGLRNKSKSRRWVSKVTYLSALHF